MRAQQDCEEGSAVVEFLFVGVILIALTLAVLQLGLVLHIRNTLQDAASEGARWGSLADSSPQEGVQRTKDLIEMAVGSQYAHFVTSSPTLWLGSPAIEVKVSAPLPLFGLFGPEHILVVTGHAISESIAK